MCDNNQSSEKKIENLIDNNKTALIFLKELGVEYEKNLYSLQKQFKYQEDLLHSKEHELNEIRDTIDSNLEVFSPNHNISKVLTDLNKDIDDIKYNISNLIIHQQEIEKKLEGLKLATNCIDAFNTIHEENKTDSKRLMDKGLGILEAQEIERQRIARDLHDSTVQNLTSLIHKTELCIKLIDIDMIRAKLELNSMSNTLKLVINDMRGIIYNLKPMTLDDLGLTITVQRYANKLMYLNNMEVKVTSNEETKEILSVIKLTVFRIIQEACNNIIKHANAALINIDICYDDNRLNVIVKDNGVGFNIDKINTNSTAEQSSSFGLSIMQERISLLSGSINIKSEQGLGTIVTISVPLSTYEGE